MKASCLSALLASALTLKATWAQAPALTSQAQYSALLFQAEGMAGSVIDATGCLITYALSCTDLNVCPSSSGIVKTVTQNGASSFAMTYTSSGSLSSYTFTGLSQIASETCSLYGTTLAACTGIFTVAAGSLSVSSTTTYVITQEALLSYGQVPITAGPARAQASVSSCSASGNQVVASSSPTPSFSVSIPHGNTPTSISSASSGPTTTFSSSGLSTGAKAGIGAGVGIVVVGALILGGILYFLRRKQKARKAAVAQITSDEKREFGEPSPEVHSDGVRYELYQPQLKHEMPVGREAQEMSAGHDMYAKSPTGPRYELS